MSNLIIVLVILLGVVAIAQIVRVYELSSKVRNNKEEEVSHSDNKLNAWMMLLFMISFYGFFGWLVFKYGDGGLGSSASEHGQRIDWLMDINMLWIVIPVFLLCNTLLFVFAFKYSYDKNRRAFWFPHSNKLEMIWTVIPAAVLAVIIILGLQTWNEVTALPEDGTAEVVEIYGKQFDWTVRYSGADNKLGLSDIKLISGTNPLGIVTQALLKERFIEIDAEIKALEEKIHTEGIYTPDDKFEEMVDKVDRLKRQKKRMLPYENAINDSSDMMAGDDIIARGELVLVKNKLYQFVYKSQDIIHSAYFPHFRSQMNCVPGMPTTFKFTPIMTTEEMRAEKNDPNFDYMLLCNKICGAAHSNMKLKVTVVETQAEFDTWISNKKTIAEAPAGGDK